MPTINGKFYMNRQVGQHLEEDRESSIAKELHKMKGQIKKISDRLDDSVLDMIPKRNLND